MSTAIAMNESHREMLRRIVGNIKSVVDDESVLLAGTSIEGFDRIIARKDQLAIELSRHVAVFEGQPIDDEARVLLAEATRVLGVNAERLRHHIEAVGEVAGLICDALVNANSDGTYTGHAPSRGARL